MPSRTIRQTRNGQITIPKEIREDVNLDSDDLLQISSSGGKITIVPVRAAEKSGAGSPWARELYDLFEPVRKSLEGYTEAEINAAIDDAIRGSRRDTKARNRGHAKR
jgi:AbrB family looped-hinge helix DNA binding protein